MSIFGSQYWQIKRLHSLVPPSFGQCAFFCPILLWGNSQQLQLLTKSSCLLDKSETSVLLNQHVLNMFKWLPSEQFNTTMENWVISPKLDGLLPGKS